MLCGARGSVVYVIAYPDTYVENGYGGVVELGDIPLKGAVMPMGFES